MTRRQAMKLTGILIGSGSVISARFATAALTIEMTGPSGAKGTVKLGLFQDTGEFPTGQPIHALNIEMTDGKATAVFKELEPGIYAVTAYLDKNGNGKLDKNLAGQPKEPYGFSNNARGMFGPPKFDEARFQLIAGETKIHFELK